MFTLLFLSLGWFGGKDGGLPGRHTALVELNGVIAADSEASAERINAGLQDAFKDNNTAGVILRVNSPGGSPVQANQINQEMRRLRGLHPKVPLYVVVDDVCASGGYYVAAAADKIYVDQASIVGSIGVLMDGFGFTGTMEKLGVERRLLTAGENKGFLDPFSPLTAGAARVRAASCWTKSIASSSTLCRQGAGQRLKEVPELYSGLIWTGSRSIELGLADALGQRRLRGPRSDQGRRDRRLHDPREHRRALCPALRCIHGADADGIPIRPAVALTRIIKQMRCVLAASALNSGSSASAGTLRGRRTGGLKQEDRRPALKVEHRAAPLCDRPGSDLLARKRKLHCKTQQRVGLHALRMVANNRALR